MVSDFADTIAHELSEYGAHVGYTDLFDAYLTWGDGDGILVQEGAPYPRTVRIWYDGESGRVRTTAILDDACGIPLRNLPLPEPKIRVECGRKPRRTHIYVLGYAVTEGPTAVGGVTLQEQAALAAEQPKAAALTPLRVKAYSGMTVRIEGGFYYDPFGMIRYSGEDDVLLAAPSSGNHQLAVVVLDTETGQATHITNIATTGTSADKSLFGVAELEALIYDSDYELCGAVHLYGGQTTISEDDIYRDLDPRVIVTPPPSSLTPFTQTASVTVANTTTETTLAGVGVGTLTLPANCLQVGKTVCVKASGYLTDTGTPNLTVKVKLGSTVIVSTTATALAGTISNNAWELEATITCRTVGATGTVFGQGWWWHDESTHAGTTWGMVATSATTIDTTTTQAISITAEWGTADAANTITCSNLVVEVLN